MTDLLATISAIRAENAPDAEFQLARAVMSDMATKRLTPVARASLERTALMISTRMAVISGEGMAEALDRIKAELLEEAQIIMDAFVSVIHECRAHREE